MEKCPMCTSDAVVRDYFTLIEYVFRCNSCDYSDGVKHKDEKGKEKEFNGKP